jgi:hypothetical protein
MLWKAGTEASIRPPPAPPVGCLAGRRTPRSPRFPTFAETRHRRAPTWPALLARHRSGRAGPRRSAWFPGLADIHRVLPRRLQKPWKCGQFAVRKMRAFPRGGPCIRPGPRGRLSLHRARSASRPKQFPRAVGGSRKFPGDVDESATGSVNFFGPAHLRAMQPLEYTARTPNLCCAQRSLRKLRASRLAPPCTCRGRALGFLLHRARSASRSKQLPRAVGGSRRFTGDVDKSATGSVNFFWSHTGLRPASGAAR